MRRCRNRVGDRYDQDIIHTYIKFQIVKTHINVIYIYVHYNL